MKKRVFAVLFLGSFLLTFFYSTLINSWAAGEKYPSGSVDLLCGFVPGGNADLLNRIVGKMIEKHLGVTVVPGNKPGGGGIVVASFLANSRPDGYTIAIMTPEFILQPILLGRASYALEDFSLIGQISLVTNLWVVKADSPWKTFHEFFDFAQKNPVQKYGHPGVGTATYLRAENLNKKAKLGLTNIPFKGDPENIAAVLGNHIPIAILSAMSGKAQADAGTMRILLSDGSPTAIGLDPSIPDYHSMFGHALGETDINIPFCLWVPGKTPAQIVQVLREALKKAAEEPEFMSLSKKNFWSVGYIDGAILTENLPKRKSVVKQLLLDAGLLK